jgi:hypothetical protein
VRRGNEVDPAPGLRKRAPVLPAKVEVLKTHIRMAQPIRLTIYGLRNQPDHRHGTPAGGGHDG